MRVPEQLGGEQFIILQQRGKSPIHKWGDPRYRFTTEGVQNWIDKGWNYAVLMSGDLCIVDADNAGALIEAGVLGKLPKTFTVRSGRESGIGLHMYFRLSEKVNGTKIYLEDENGSPLGDIRLPGSKFYVVGPGSIHPSGNKYSVIVDEQIRHISWGEIESSISGVHWRVSGIPKEVEEMPKRYQGEEWGRYGLDVRDFLMPRDPHTRGDEIEGKHPVHGSTTGTNLTIKADGSLWYCRRCGTGGNWIDALAVAEGIVDCGDVGKQYSKGEWRDILSVLKHMRPEEYAKARKERLEEHVRKTCEFDGIAKKFFGRAPEV